MASLIHRQPAICLRALLPGSAEAQKSRCPRSRRLMALGFRNSGVADCDPPLGRSPRGGVAGRRAKVTPEAALYANPGFFKDCRKGRRSPKRRCRKFNRRTDEETYTPPSICAPAFVHISCRHCERSEAIQRRPHGSGLLRRLRRFAAVPPEIAARFRPPSHPWRPAAPCPVPGRWRSAGRRRGLAARFSGGRIWRRAWRVP